MTSVTAYRVDTVDDVQRGFYVFVQAHTENEARRIVKDWLPEHRASSVSGPFLKDYRQCMNGTPAVRT